MKQEAAKAERIGQEAAERDKRNKEIWERKYGVGGMGKG